MDQVRKPKPDRSEWCTGPFIYTYCIFSSINERKVSMGSTTMRKCGVDSFYHGFCSMKWVYLTNLTSTIKHLLRDVLIPQNLESRVALLRQLQRLKPPVSCKHVSGWQARWAHEIFSEKLLFPPLCFYWAWRKHNTLIKPFRSRKEQGSKRQKSRNWMLGMTSALEFPLDVKASYNKTMEFPRSETPAASKMVTLR